ncbi:MAG: hypothetical protein ABIG94_03575 [Pseudomonadota bacterium]
MAVPLLGAGATRLGLGRGAGGWALALTGVGGWGPVRCAPVVVAPVVARGHGSPQGGAALSLMVYHHHGAGQVVRRTREAPGGRGCADGRVGPWTLERWTVVVAVAARVGPGTGCCVGGAGAGSLALGQRSVVDGCRYRVRGSRGRAGAWPCTWGRSVRGNGLGVWWSPQERASHCFNLAFSQVVNTPCRVGSVAGPSVQAAAGPT